MAMVVVANQALCRRHTAGPTLPGLGRIPGCAVREGECMEESVDLRRTEFNHLKQLAVVRADGHGFWGLVGGCWR